MKKTMMVLTIAMALATGHASRPLPRADKVDRTVATQTVRRTG